MKNIQPMVSIIVCCDNQENKIEKTVRSIIDQDYLNKSIVIVDNASEDNSWNKICDLLNQQDDFQIESNIGGTSITALRHEYQGDFIDMILSGANIIWKNMDIMGIVHAGDEYLPGKISKSIKYMENTAGRTGILYSDYESVIDNIPITIYQDSFIRERLAYNVPFDKCVLITKKSMEVVGMINPNKGDEALQDLWLRITERFVAIHIPEILTKCQN